MEIFEKISSLILSSLREDIEKEDEWVLEEWIRASDENAALFHGLSDQQTLVAKIAAFREADSAAIWRKTLEKIESDPTRMPWKKGRRIGYFYQSWKFVAAAITLLIAGSTYILLRFLHPVQEGVSPTSGPAVVSSGNAVAPGCSRAVLKLADGSVFVLDKMKNGLLAERGGVNIEKTSDGELSYIPGTRRSGMPRSHAGEVMENTLTTPRGGQYKLVLPDGTRVWLNAGSSLKYPAAFGSRGQGVERSVILNGEAYFEVASLPIPFRVNIPATGRTAGDRGSGGSVEVLGTHFDIMAYDDEPDIRASLLKGSIRVNDGLAPVILKPGQQAVFTGANGIRVINTPGDARAWVDGHIQLDGQDLSSILRQLSRWYNMDIEYRGKIPSMRLSGTISRSTSIGELLKILNIQGGREISFRMEGRKIWVTNKK
ncbi:MAG: DUF4974 domain-containing protein [Puia sp.]|nr:DUF4974 domain-containing protein [Puia sp.]